MSIQNALNAAVYTKLTAATALTSLLAGTTSVYYLQAPDGAALPYVVFNQQGGGPENINPSDMRRATYWVRGYADTPALAGSIDAQLSTAIHGGSLAVSGYTNFWTRRIQDISIVENLPNGESVYTGGGMYDIRLDS